MHSIDDVDEKDDSVSDKTEESSLEVVGVTKLSQLSLNAPEFIFEKPESSSIKIDKYFYDINTLFCNSLNMRTRRDGDNASYDSSNKERHFDVVNMNQCQFVCLHPSILLILMLLVGLEMIDCMLFVFLCLYDFS